MALGLVSMRLGRDASDQHTQTMALVALATPLGEADAGLGLWAAYGRFEQPTAVTPHTAVSDLSARIDDSDSQLGVQLQRPEVSVPSAERSVGIVDWRVLVEQYDWPIGEAVRIVLCESSGNPSARNGTSIGLFQVNTAAHSYSVAQMLDPAQNIKAAYAIWADSGWAPWSCQP